MYIYVQSDTQPLLKDPELFKKEIAEIIDYTHANIADVRFYNL